MEKVTEGAEVKAGDPKMGIGFGPPAIALGELEVTGVRDSKLAFRTTPYPSSLVTYVLASFGMAQDSSQNE